MIDIQLPYPGMIFVPLDILTAEEMNHIVANYTYIAGQFDILDEALGAKQDILSTTQLEAVNSGINSAKIETYDNYPDLLEEKQDLLDTVQLEAVNSGVTAEKMTELANIKALIPATASASNSLTDKDFVNSSINSVSAFFITYNAAGAPFPSKAALETATVFYYAGETRTPTKNDYCLVNADESHDGAACRYVLQQQEGELVWAFQYKVNATAFTAEQLAVLDSGITAERVATYDGYGELIGNVQSILHDINSGNGGNT